MAFIPYFAFGPTSLMGLIGLLHGPDKTIPTPMEDWRQVTVDLVIPAFNEEKTIVLCLSSILRQSLKPRQIILFDDASTDKTIAYARDYAKMMAINLKVIRRKKSEGKTPSVYYATHNSDADVLAVVDGDTILRSDNYLERLVQELFQGVGIACACGTVLPLAEADRTKESLRNHISDFSKLHPEATFSPDSTAYQRAQRALTNAYREELYLFLQRFIYHGEMVFCGSLIFPVGCAVVYRRTYLKNIFDHFITIFGFDLTTSEDIFFGFAFADIGYRNVGVQDVYALTTEPRFFRMYHQIFKWSSSFLQSCYYFDSIFFTPFKLPRYAMTWIKRRYSGELNAIHEKRKIKEAYRQSFGIEYTKKFGRNIGFFIFTTACEKLSYPTFIIVFIILKLWVPLLITLLAECSIYVVAIAMMHKNRRIRNVLKAILFTPIRYSQVMFDLVVIGKFTTDLWVTKNRRWRK